MIDHLPGEPAWIDNPTLTVTLAEVRASIAHDAATRAAQTPQASSARAKPSRDHHQQPLPGRKSA